jgi:hypothetical protein
MTRSIGQNSRRIRGQSQCPNAWTKSTRDTSRTNGRNASSFKGGSGGR